MATRDYTIIVYGATSFVGQILTRYLFERHGAGGQLRWAIAGRSREKLERVRGELGAGAETLPLVVADAGDEATLRAMCDQADAVVSTVGPYMFYGSTLVKVCAGTGTDYCDLTGEVPWISRMIEAHEEQARQSGARIVHCCGFDSIPSDLGVYFLQSQALNRFGKHCNTVKMRVKAMRGSFSGGTVASMMNMAKMAASDPAVRRLLANPYVLCPKDRIPEIKQTGVKFSEYDTDFDAWAAPFVMAGINTRVVHRSNALSDHAYGRDFRYDEAMLAGAGLRGRAGAMAIASGLGGFMTLAALPPTRWFLQRFVVPKPGEGPGPEAQAKGFYDLRFVGETTDGQKIKVKVTGDRDPGYGSTAKMLGEAIVCLATETERDRVSGGFWTPATALGTPLVERLTAHAGMTFEILE
jgi:short subunit dehydrogenase-like uncharacterized protein